jgi:hypothetical protein
MPRSNSHTSPRVGVIFGSFEAREKLVGGQSGLQIVQRPGVEWYCPAQDFHGEEPLFLFGQSFEGIQQLSGLLAHAPLWPQAVAVPSKKPYLKPP